MTLTGPWRRLLFVLGTLALLAGLCVTTVPEDRQGVLLRMGKPLAVYNRFATGGPSGAGLVVHWPVIEQVEMLERSLVSFATEPQNLRSGDQQQLQVSADAIVRIIDPVRLTGSAGTSAKAIEQLRAVLASQLQGEVGRLDAVRLAMPGAGGAAQALRTALDAKARPLGVQVIDVRIGGVALSAGQMQETFARMIEIRDQKAQQELNRGREDAQRIYAEGGADAARIVQAAAGKDPEFYDFFRAMRSYEETLKPAEGNGKTTIVVGPDSEYLKQFKGR